MMFFAILVVVFDFLAIVNVVRSSLSANLKALWIAMIVLAPVLGAAGWVLTGPHGRQSNAW